MYEDTPNKEEIDWVAQRLREIYNYEDLKDCDIDYLYNLEYGVESRMMVFEGSFPPEGGMEGPLRAFVHDNKNEEKVALTNAERIRLELLKEEVRKEIRRARGHRLEIRREQRNKLANSVADMISGFADLAPWR